MDNDDQPFSIHSPYSPHPTNQNCQQPLRDHVLHPAPRQYTASPDFQDNYGNELQSSMLRYRDSSRSVKEEHDPNAYIYTPTTDFTGEMNNLIVHHPTHPDHNTIRYPASHNLYSSDLNMRMASSCLETPEARLASGPDESAADFRYQIRALQLQQQHLLHPQRPLPHHQHQNISLSHLQGGSAFYSPYSSQDQEISSPSIGGLDQPSSLEYDPRESHAQHVPVPGMVYDPLPVPGHSQQGIRRDTTMTHHGSLASINSSNSGSASYHTANSPASSIPMSNNHGTTSSMNTSVLGAHISSPFGIGPSNSRWAGHPSGFDMAGSTAAHSQVPALSSTPASASASSSSLRPSLRHAESSDSRSTPENSFTQDNFHLRASSSAQTLSSSHSPSPRVSDNESSPGGRHLGNEMFNPDDRESDQDVETVTRMSEKSSAGKKKAETSTPAKKKKKSKMHYCDVCLKKFPRPSGLKTHMNSHSNKKPFPCGFPGCARSFSVRSNAKRHLRTHGVIPTPAINSADAPYIVGFCPPMIGVPRSSSHQPSQLHSIEGGGEDFPPPGSRLPGDNTDIQGQGQGSSVPTLKLRWMPPSLTTRTNAGSLREVVDEQQMHWMGNEEDGEDDDDVAAGGNVRRTSGGGGYDMDMDQDDTDDEVEFGGENISSISFCPVIPSSSTSAGVASSTRRRLTMSRPAECMCSPPCSESSTQGRCRSSSSSSRMIASISPSSASFAGSNSSLSPPSMSGYGHGV